MLRWSLFVRLNANAMEAFNQAYDEITSVKSFPSVSSSESCHVINGGMVQKNRIRDIKPLLKISSILEKKPNYVEVFPDEEMRDESEQTKISDLEVSGDSRYLQAHVDEDQSCDQDSLEVEYKTFGNGKVKLTNEERETFVSEGLPLPSGVPLTKAEERALKRIRRKIKNKLSAQESRRKKKEYVEGLEKRAEACNSENSILRQKVDSLESTVRALLTELNRLRKVPLENKNRKRTQMESRGTQTGTCLKCLMRRSAAYRQQNFGRLETLRENNNLPKDPCNRLARFDAHN